MSYLLHVDSSPLGEASVSRYVARSFLERWTGEVVHRDLATAPVPHIGAAGITARDADPAARSAEQGAEAALQDWLIEELIGARAYLSTVPMYNRTVPSTFKAWLDQILIVGRTIGGASPIAGRPAVVISARGGSYGPGTPKEGFDYVVPFLEAVLGHGARPRCSATVLGHGARPRCSATRTCSASTSPS